MNTLRTRTWRPIWPKRSLERGRNGTPRQGARHRVRQAGQLRRRRRHPLAAALDDAPGRPPPHWAGQALFARVEALHTSGGKPVVAADPRAVPRRRARAGAGLRYPHRLRRRAKTQLGQPEVQLGPDPRRRRHPAAAAAGRHRAALDLMMSGGRCAHAPPSRWAWSTRSAPRSSCATSPCAERRRRSVAADDGATGSTRPSPAGCHPSASRSSPSRTTRSAAGSLFAKAEAACARRPRATTRRRRAVLEAVRSRRRAGTRRRARRRARAVRRAGRVARGEAADRALLRHAGVEEATAASSADAEPRAGDEGRRARRRADGRRHRLRHHAAGGACAPG